jgi:hypothetical protein
MASIPNLKIKTSNIPYLHNYDLASKLTCAQHPTINDVEGAKLVIEEIEKRKNDGEWTT